MNEETEVKEEAGNSLAVRESYEVRRMAREMMKDSPSLFFNVVKFEHGQRVAAMLAKSSMVPEHFRGNIGNCMIALNYADRLDLDPFMLMQSMFVVHGRPGIEGKALIALINRSGQFDGPLEWEFTGTEGTDDWTCTAYATHKKTGKRLEMPISWKTVKAEGWLGKQGSKWQTMPAQMFRYRTASWFANAFCPEVKLGLHTIEELQDTIELAPQTDGTYAKPLQQPPAVENVKAATAAKLEDMKARLKQPAEPPAPAPEPEPEPPAPADESGPLARDRWIRLKGPGFRAYIEDNIDCLEGLSLNAFSEISKKWTALYNEDFPYNLDGTRRDTVDGPQDSPQAEEVSEEEAEARQIKADILRGYAGQYKEALKRLGSQTDELPESLDGLIAVQEMCAAIIKEDYESDEDDRF